MYSAEDRVGEGGLRAKKPFHLRLGARVRPVRILERRRLGDRETAHRLPIDGRGADEDVLARVPAEQPDVARHCRGREQSELTDDIEVERRELAVRVVVLEVANDDVTLGR